MVDISIERKGRLCLSSDVIDLPLSWHQPSVNSWFIPLQLDTLVLSLSTQRWHELVNSSLDLSLSTPTLAPLTVCHLTFISQQEHQLATTSLINITLISKNQLKVSAAICPHTGFSSTLTQLVSTLSECLYLDTDLLRFPYIQVTSESLSVPSSEIAFWSSLSKKLSAWQSLLSRREAFKVIGPG